MLVEKQYALFSCKPRGLFRCCYYNSEIFASEHTTYDHNHWTTQRLGISTGPNRVGVSLPHLRMETVPVSETLFLIFRIPDDGQSAETQ
jgi:hypothetical protein